MITIKGARSYSSVLEKIRSEGWRLLGQSVWVVTCFLSSPSWSPTPPPTSSSQPPWLTAVTTCCANWKRPWLVLFPNRSGWCPVVFFSAGGWQLAFRLRRSAVWTLASLFRPLAPLPPSLSWRTHIRVQRHTEWEETAARHLFLSCCMILRRSRNYSGENCSRINRSGPQEVKKKTCLWFCLLHAGITHALHCLHIKERSTIWNSMKMQTIPSRLPFERALQTLKDKKHER